jgi:uncharacterized repeat protein (TIGR03833 family)
MIGKVRMTEDRIVTGFSGETVCGLSICHKKKVEMMSTDGRQRTAIRPGLLVDIVLKKDQATGRTTRGVVKDILTKSPNHPHGIKVRLQSGDVGRVKAIVSDGAPE